MVNITVPEDHRYTVLGTFAPDEVFPYLSNSRKSKSSRRRIYIDKDGVTWSVKMTSIRLWMFREKGLSCVACGAKGVFLSLEKTRSLKDVSPHFNLYAVVDGKWIMMTKDHIVPASKCGSDSLRNLQPMCSVCNELKADGNLSPEQVATVRESRKE